MILKRIELAGFKSFAERTELEFVQGITAVVGPNGSGKSNISDGIRWVLGEQSAKSLRGGKMEDIIFAGSNSRKAVNYSEVSLTLDNSDQQLPLDFTEVTVTRRVDRNGDSEYAINKQPCRLKDITELFMDTGIGKEAYSIIGQGRIEEILSTKSEDRRGIFEEASGIVKYKSRKKEAEKKLADTEQNLLRIGDLLAELEVQVEPLREQSRKAAQYKELKEQLKANEIAVYVDQIDRLYADWNETNEQLARLGDERNRLATVVSRHDAKYEKHRQESHQLEEQLEQLQGALLDLSKEVERCEGQGGVLQEREKNLTSNLDAVRQALEAQESRLADKLKEQQIHEEKTQAVSERLRQCEADLAEEEVNLLGMVNGADREQVEKLKADMLASRNRIEAARGDIRHAEQQIEAARRRRERLQADREKWITGQNALALRRQDLDNALDEVTAEIDRISNQYIEIGKQLSDRQTVLGEAGAMARKLEQRRDGLVSRKETMQEMHNDYDGFQQGVKEVLRARNRSGGPQGIHGAVAELVKVPKEVEAALETALGGALQNIVVNNESQGRDAISYLKQRQMGRATFLPLDVIKGRYIAKGEMKPVQEDGGFVGMAVDLVQFEEAYEQIFSNLLGQVIIARTLQDANRIAAKCRYRYRVVTLEGDVVNAGGSMTGGSRHRNAANLLGRKRQIEELADQIAEVEEELMELQDRMGKLKTEMNGWTQNLEQLRGQGEQRRIAEQQIRAEIAPMEGEQQRFADQLSVCGQDIADVDAEIGQLSEAIESARLMIEHGEHEEELLQEAVHAAEALRQSSESAIEEQQALLVSLKVARGAAQQELQFLREQGQRLDQDLQTIRAEREERRRQEENYTSELESIRQAGVEQLEQLNRLNLLKRECAEKIEFTRSDRADWVQRLEAADIETREQRNELNEVERKLHAVEVKVNRLDVELDNLLKKLAEEYGMGYELAKERYPVPEDIASAQGAVKHLKKEIAALGEVNLGAIEEFNRVNERYTFLHTQQGDLVEAKSTLYQVIKEIDQEMSSRFLTTFAEIREHFLVVFAKLFGGGRADLILSDAGEPLNTGIEIIAQPPGKKLQNLSLLSGGERALTAIALLFAILRVKPVPFCVLDEVEAALDESNVDRFADYLREFSELTQFIVVTHRKGMMERSDVLYGVTMEEDGVSKLVSVRLEDTQAVSA